ncbi:MAG: DUF4105 domain-containing protein [Gammaproteobacteria bacterium]|nr:DUF4105 domain-containing protein [Gammaproteobacteria bacterium]
MRGFSGLFLLLLLLSPFASSFADETRPAGGPEIWLLTYGPGDIYWQRFGHNALWVRDPGRGLDHAFNFGFFDFEQEDFFLRFLQGRMLYFSAARPAQKEFAAYIDENRGIRAQKLNLTGEQAHRLAAYLVDDVRPENRDYLYDYYRNNCSTRVRDAIDLALDGALNRATADVAAGQSWRDHTRRLTETDFWLYLGLEIVLGAHVDRPGSRWGEMFIPSELADVAAGFALERGGRQEPLVVEDVVLHAATSPLPPASPSAWWPRYLLASLALLAASWAVCRRLAPRLGPSLARGWLILAGLAGFALLFFWFGTDHAVAANNLNLQVINPLWLVLGLQRGRERAGLWIVLFFSALSLLMPLLPPWQYTLDVLAAFLPLNLAAAWVLYRSSRNAPGA